MSATTSEPSTQPVEYHAADTADGVALILTRRVATAPRRGVLLCTHAMMANSRYFGVTREGGFAAAMATAGIDVFALDWRGHGASRPPFAERDQWRFDDYVELDLPAALATVSQVCGVPAREISILGHSLGGLVALAALGRGIVSCKKLVAAATSVWRPGPGPSARRSLLSGIASLGWMIGHVPVRAFGAGSDNEPAAYLEQLAGWSRTGAWTSGTGLDYASMLSNVQVPVLGICGAGDWMCRPADASELLDRIPGARPLRIVGRAQGDVADADHFSLFVHRFETAWQEIAEFVVG